MVELKDLVERSRTGDLDAFAEIVRRFQDMAHGYAYSMLGDFHLAEDATQEAFIEAFYALDNLREPAAFPCWFRRIVFKQCDRIRRKRQVPMVPLEEGLQVAKSSEKPTDLQQQVLDAVRDLTDRQRETVTLYYINGYSQKEIAEFLEVPLTAVQKRLHDSREKLMNRMLNMFEDTLKDNAPDGQFSQRIINELQAKPNLMLIPNHPVQQAFETFRTALADYEWIAGDEVIDIAGNVDVPDTAFRVDDSHALRTSTTPILLRAMAGRAVPLRLMTAGRAFRAGQVSKDPLRANVFHMIDVVCVDTGLGEDDFKRHLNKVLLAVLGQVETIWKPMAEQLFGIKESVIVSVPHESAHIQIAAGGIFRRDFLASAGFKDDVSGFNYGIGLERTAMAKLNLDNIHALWSPPFVP